MRWIFVVALLAGCSEYEWNSDLPTPQGGDEALSPTGGGDGGGGGGAQTGSGTTDDGFGGGGAGGGEIPDEFIDDDCADGILATWHSGEIYVLASSSGPAVGELEVPAAGIYEIYDLAIAESGASQRNESAYLRVPTGAVQDGSPVFGNCSGDYVVPDSDNNGPPPAGTAQYLGTFWLAEGVNTVEMHHYCWLIDDGGCTTFLDPAPGHGCAETGNPNSVHMTGEALCLRPVD